jgi:hypothetical protein
MLEFGGSHAGLCRTLLAQMSEFVIQACGKLSSRRPLSSQWQSARPSSRCDEEKLLDHTYIAGDESSLPPVDPRSVLK